MLNLIKWEQDRVVKYGKEDVDSEVDSSGWSESVALHALPQVLFHIQVRRLYPPTITVLADSLSVKDVGLWHNAISYKHNFITSRSYCAILNYKDVGIGDTSHDTPWTSLMT